MEVGFIDLPADSVDQNTGFSIDFGGSLLKIVYRTKQAQAPPRGHQKGQQRICLKTYTGSEVESALQEIENNCDISLIPGTESTVTCTGYRCHTNVKSITQRLGVTVQVATEYDLMVKALVFLLHHLPVRDVIVSTPTAWQDKSFAERKGIATLWELSYSSGATHNRSITDVEKKMVFEEIEQTLENRNRSTVDNTTSWIKQEGNTFPILYANMGSAILIMEVYDEKNFRVVDTVSPRGGKALIGMGKALTGAKTFDELLEMAKVGDSSAVNQTVGDLFVGSEMNQKTSDDTSGAFYNDMENIKSSIAFSFGKVAEAENSKTFQREDLAQAIIEHFAMDIAHVICLNALRLGIQNVMVGGGLSHNEMVRKTMLNFAEGLLRPYTIRENQVLLHFLQHGCHLGAIGGFLS